MSWKLCPKCKVTHCRVIDSRWVAAGHVRRRYACHAKDCGHRFTTIEVKLLEGETALDYVNPKKAAADDFITDLTKFIERQYSL